MRLIKQTVSCKLKMKMRCGEKQRIKCKRKQKKLLKIIETRNKKSLPLFVSVGSVRYSKALCFVSVEKSSKTVYHALVAG